jgi:rhodanese-related sulfurtransferase
MIKINLAGCGRILLVNVGIVVLSASIGISLNRSFVAGPKETVLSYSNEGGKVEFKPVPAGQVEPAEVPLSEVRKIVASKSMVLLDGRSQSEYENGHLPGAFSLGVADFDKRFPEFAAQHSKDGIYLIYCGSGQCGLSRQLAGLLRKKGYDNTKLYLAGYNEWFLAGNPIEKGKGGSSK